MSKIKFGIIGTGGMAHWHARQIGASGLGQIAATCDIDRARAQSFATLYNAERVYDDFNKMIADGNLDAVAIVTSNDVHYTASMTALANGLHVMCEKPLAMNVQQAQELSLIHL